MIDIPDEIKEGVDVIPVKWIDQVIEIALTKEPKRLSKDLKGDPSASKNTIHVVGRVFAMMRPVVHKGR